MSKRTQLLQALGVDNAQAAFERSWAPHIPTKNSSVDGRTTISRQEFQRRARATGGNVDGYEKNFKGFAAALIGLQIAAAQGQSKDFMALLGEGVKAGGISPTVKAAVEGAGIGNAGSIGGNVANGVVPLVFDPDIVQILKDTAPVLERIPDIGQQGFKAVTNRIDARGTELGFRSETAALDLSAETENDDTYQQIEVDMEIWLDKVVTSDYARAAGMHYFDVRDTQLGQRVQQHAQAKERNVLYGDPSLATTTGGFGDAQGYDGFAEIITDAGNNVDKSLVSLSGTDALIKDIKAEIAGLLQSTVNSNPADLEIWCSHTLFDELENELQVHRRYNDNFASVDYGYESIRIKGVPVFATHNIRAHTDDGNIRGDDGDVFIMNRREFQFRSLMPLSTVPLARVGLAEQSAMAEFGAPILRGAGNLCRYLEAYNI